MNRRHSIVFCLALLFLASLACALQRRPTATPPPPPTATPAPAVFAQVGTDTLTLLDFRAQVLFDRYSILKQVLQYQQMLQMFGNSTDLSQVNAELQRLTDLMSDSQAIGQQAIDELVDACFIRQEAARRGLTVSAQEVDQRIETLFAANTGGTPTSSAMAFAAYLADLQAQTGLTEADFRRLVEDLLYREKLTAALAPATPEELQVWVRHILLADEATARQVLTRLQAGEDFATLAAEVSQDTGTVSTGGDLGWFGAGVMVSEFEQAAFSLAVGEISQPIKTQFGWHVLQVLGREKRPLSSDQARALGEKLLQDWLASQRPNQVTVMPGWEDFVPTQPSLPNP